MKTKYIGGFNKAEILSQSIVYDNGGESYDRYTIFTPDGSVFGMSEDGRGFNLFLGDHSEIEEGEHLGKKLKSVPKSIQNAVLNRMVDDEMYEEGGVTNFNRNNLDKYVLDELQGNTPSKGVKIARMKEILQSMFPDSFGFKLYPIQDVRFLVPNIDNFYGVDDSELKIAFDSTHAMDFRVFQGDENTYFYFILIGSDGKQYIGDFGFKDRGEVPKAYLTSFVAFLMKVYGNPFSIAHSVFESGGEVDDDDLIEDDDNEYAKGGQVASIGDSGIITDKNSMHIGKMATISGDLGNMYEVFVIGNSGQKVTTIVKKNGINIISDEYAKGGKVDKYEVELQAVSNPDFGNQGYMNIKKHKKSASSINELVYITRNFIQDNDLGGGNFPNAKIYKNGKEIGYISYNGRVWDKTQNPMKYEYGGRSNSNDSFLNKWDVIREQVRFAFAKVLGIDRAIDILDRKYGVSPYHLVERAVYSDLLLINEIDEDLIDSAINEAEDSNEMEEIGSSDQTYMIKYMLDGAGLKTDFVNGRLERVDANGNMITLKNELPSSTMFAKGGKTAESILQILMTEEPKVWDKFGFNSGGEIRESKEKTKKYAQELEKVFSQKGIKRNSLSQKVYDELQNENYHLLNEFLGRNGYFKKAINDSLTERYESPSFSKYYADKESITVSPSKSAPKKTASKKIQRKKLSTKTTYVPRRDIKSIELKNSKSIPASDIVDGVYKKK
jgi:hypothetical protein